MGLPLKLLPRAYAAWKVLDPTRPFQIEPVAVDEYIPPGVNPRVISSVVGKIDTLVFYYPSFQERKEDRQYGYSEFMIELVGAMKSYGRKFIVVVQKSYALSEDKKEILIKRAEEEGHSLEIIYINYTRTTLSPWIQDAFLPIQYQMPNGKYKTFLVESVVNKVQESIKAVVEASDNTPTSNLKGLEYQESNLPFVGGNVLAGADFTLIGLHDSCRDALELIGKKWIGNYILLSSQLPEFLAAWPKGKYTQDGVLNFMQSKSDDQVIYHIDLFITLAGAGVRRRKTEFILVGEPCIGFEGLEEAEKDLQEMVQKIIEETSAAITTMIQQIEEGMKKLGKRYKIIRNPLPLTYYDAIEKKDQPNTKVRYFSWATFNNCLVEQYKEEEEPVNRVFLPSYGGLYSDYSEYPKDKNPKYGSWRDLHKYDEQNKKIWEQQLGYEVVLLETDYNPFVKHQGSLNCLTNCIVRKNNFH